VLSSSGAVQIEGNEGGYVYTVYSGYTMNDSRNEFRLDLALALLVGMIVAFYLITIIFK
jgi:hypothetical protein